MDAYQINSITSHLNNPTLPDDLKIIGAGGFGDIYYSPSYEIVIKAVKNECIAGSNEFEKHTLIFNLFEDLKNQRGDIIDLVNKYVTIPIPLSENLEPVIINGKEYMCYFVMSYLPGISISEIPNLDKIDSTYLNTLKSLMVHLSLNADFQDQAFGIKYNKEKISKNNPPRGYFINRNSNFVDTFLPKSDIKKIIGFVYGLIYYKLGYDPKDIEFTLGKQNGYQINVLDFGMIQPTNKSASQIIEDLSLDLYCDIEDDPDCLEGFESAK